MDLAGGHEPGFYINRVSQTPLLMIVGTHDVECHYEISLAAHERALQPKRLVTVKGGDFVCYVEQFSPASKEAVPSFQEYLT